MNNWRVTAQTEPYKSALVATETLGDPAVGFVNPKEETQKGTTVIIKQNNIIIQLLVKISENLFECKEAIQDIKRVVAEKSAGTSLDISKSLEELQKGFQQLSIGEPIPKPKKKETPLYVFKDPNKIIEEEKRKSSFK